MFAIGEHVYPPTVVADRPDAVAYVMAGSGMSITYRELDRQSNQLAHFWQDRGVVPGDAVMIAMENNLAWPVVMAAGMRSGLYVTPVNWHLKPTELAVLLAEAAPKAIVTSTAVADAVAAALTESGVRDVVTICVDAEREGFTALDAALAGRPDTPIPDELLGARVLYSGGTTGRPKRFAQQLLGVHPTQAPQRHSALVERLGIDVNTRLLSPAPNYHAAPFTFTLITLAAGGTVVCMERFDAEAAMAAIARHGVTHSQWVPTMLVRLLRLPDRARIPLSPNHRVAFVSGAPCPGEVKNAMLEWWGPILHEYYGASEGYGHTYISPDEAITHPGSVGRPLGATRVRIVDESGRGVDAGQRGRVCFEQISGQASDTDPALRQMGDLGYLDDDGFLYLVGREGFMIISGGVNIYPEEIEDVLLGHPDVLDAGVVGVPDAEFGESVKAVVERSAGCDVTATDLIDYCRTRLAHYKAPRIVEFTDSMPRLPTGKLDKRTLTARFAQGEKV